MNWVGIAALAILFGSVLLGWYRGFLKTILAMVQLIATIILVMLLSPIVKNILIENTGLYHQTKSSIISAIEEKLPELPEGAELPPEMQNTLIENSSIPTLFQGLLKENNRAEVYEELGAATFLEYVGSYMADLIVGAVSFLIVFVVIRIAFQIRVLAFDLLGRLPVLGGINRLAGAAVGALRGLIILWILCLLATVFPDTRVGQDVLFAAGSSGILSWVYNNNLLFRFLLLLKMSV